MRPEEAAWIGAHLTSISDVSPVLELGARTDHFRRVEQPHIDRFIHGPLRARGVKIVTTDFDQFEGIDVAGDIFDPAVQRKLKAKRPKTLLCCNFFEHVVDRDTLAQVCADLLPAGGYLVVTVPYSYPHHNAPIDTYYRPTPEQVIAMFPQFDVIDSAVLSGETFGQRLLRERPAAIFRTVVKRIWWLMHFWVDRSTYATLNHRVLWLFRAYRHSCVVLRKR